MNQNVNRFFRFFFPDATATSHPTVPDLMGKPCSTSDMLSKASEPGPIRFQAFMATRWKLNQQTMVNLKHPKAIEAGLRPGEISAYQFFYSFVHPVEGMFLIDTGVPQSYIENKDDSRLSKFVRKALKLKAIEVLIDTHSWLKQQDQKLVGVFLTHLHADHLLGLCDLPKDTPLYVGPEARSRALVHHLSKRSTDRLLKGFSELRELVMKPDPAGLFSGVIDLFGDRTVYSIHVPGHTAGSMAFFLRTIQGPVLVTGDAARSAWGWEHCVPGAGIAVHHAIHAAKSIDALKSFAARVPGIEIHLGHQLIEQSDT